MENSIMYARWATDFELKQFIDAITQKNKSNYLRNKIYLDKRKEKILDTFEELSQKFKDEYNSRLEKKGLYRKAYISQKCICGSDVTYIESHGFHGCSNYNNKSIEHFNFIDRPHLYEYYMNRDCSPITNHWVNDVRSMSGIDKKVSTANVFQFLMENGKYDISLAYGYRPTEDIVNRYKGARKRAVSFEEEVRSKLIEIHPGSKINHQQAIKYKYFDYQDKFAICDFIVTTHDTVIIYEVKLNQAYTDEVQKEKYIDLVSYIIQSKKMDLKLEFKYVVKTGNGSILILED